MKTHSSLLFGDGVFFVLGPQHPQNQQQPMLDRHGHCICFQCNAPQLQQRRGGSIASKADL
jgi:hypothetical protein